MSDCKKTNLFTGEEYEKEYESFSIQRLEDCISNVMNIFTIGGAWVIGDFLNDTYDEDSLLEVVVPDTVPDEIRDKIRDALIENIHPNVKVWGLSEINPKLKDRPYAPVLIRENKRFLELREMLNKYRRGELPDLFEPKKRKDD